MAWLTTSPVSTTHRRKDQHDMAADIGPGTVTGSSSSATKAYRNKIGFTAESPNFPGDWRQVIEKVKIADELGFDSVWLGESWGYELFTSMADLVRETKRIKIGAGIANIYSRSPALIASTVATLDERSGGRIILGLGPSGANVIEHWHGVPFEKPVKRTREYVEIADCVLPVYWPGNKWGELRAQLDEGARLAGRPAHSAAIAPYITSVIVPENADEEQRAAIRFKAAAPLAYYIGKMGVYYAQMLTRNGFGVEVQAVIEGWKQGMKSAIEAVDPQMLDAVSIIGTPKEVVAKLDQWAASGVDEPLLAMPAGSVDEAASELGALKDALDLEP